MPNTGLCADLSSDPAFLFVSGGYDTFVNLANQAYQLTVEQTQELNNLVIAPIPFQVNFDFEGQLAAFQRPAPPVIDNAALEFRPQGSVAAPPGFTEGSINAAPVPVQDLTPPSLVYGPSPNAPTIEAPIAPPAAPPIVLPTEPDYTLPAVPTFEQLNLPTLPDIQLPEFDGARPVFVEPPLNENWSFTPEDYASELLDDLTAQVRRMMQGGTGLPAAIEQALFDRSRERVDEETLREAQATFDEFGTRGFTEPNGILTGRLLEVRQGAQNRKAENNRDITIRVHEVEVENVRFAVTQGIALEGVLINLHQQEQALLLQAAQFQRETAIAILNARISVFNAQLTAYQTDAQVLESRIRAELAKVEVFRAQIEGERVRGEINEQRVRLYAEQVRAVNLLADFYRTRVQAVQAQVDIEKSVVDRFRAQVDAYGERWRAFGSEADAYRATVQAEGEKANVYSTLANVFNTRVNAWNTGESLKIERERLRIQSHGQQLDAWRGQLDTLLANLQAEQARLQAVATSIGAKAQIYTAQAGVEQAASAATDRSFQLGLEKERAEVDTSLKAAEIRIQENIQLTQVMVRLKETLTQVLAQLAASSMSAVNFSASVGSSKSNSRSCSTSYSWSGEIADIE